MLSQLPQKREQMIQGYNRLGHEAAEVLKLKLVQVNQPQVLRWPRRPQIRRLEVQRGVLVRVFGESTY